LDNLDFGQGCSDLATKGTEGSDESTPEFVLPSLNGEVDGHTVVVGVLATGLHGPGSYTAGEQNSVTVDAPQDAEGENLFSAGDSSQVGKITINGDGSGTLTFANWLDNGGSDNTLSGELDWTCS
jgi:hypothetical protein